jgi:hypothetical protein
MALRRFTLFAGLIALMFLFVAADSPPDSSVQADFDRFMIFLSNPMFEGGREITITTKLGASDEELITAAVVQLNNVPAALREWHVLKKEHLTHADFKAFLQKKYPDQFKAVHLSSGDWAFPEITSQSNKFLVAVIDSDQGRKIIAVDEDPRVTSPVLRASMHNCDAAFSSPMDGGTPLIR